MSIAQVSLWLVGKESALISYDREKKCSWLIERDGYPDDYGYVLCNGVVTQWNIDSESFITCSKIKHRLEAFNDNVTHLRDVNGQLSHNELRSRVLLGAMGDLQ
jgi:hypothetical protein